MNPASVHRLLDIDDARELVATVLPDAREQELTFDALWAKPGRYFNVCYRVGTGAPARRVSLCVVDAADGHRAMRWLRELQLSEASAHGIEPLAMPEADILVQAFPYDYRMPRLLDCVQASATAPVLGNGAVDCCEVAAYRPGMRCQIRYSAHGVARAYGKHAVERDPGRRRRVHAALCEATASGTMRVPPLLGSVEAAGLDLVGAVAGRSLHDLLSEGSGPSPLATTMQALCELHDSVPPPADRVYTPADEIALLASWVSWMEDIAPQLAVRARATLASLEQAQPAGSCASLAHRDFYDKQILVDGGCQWLLDVDTACTGHRELDVGNFLAHLLLRGLQWNRRAVHDELEAIAEDAYGRAAQHGVTRWYRRASLLRLACGYWLRPHWRHLVPDLLEESARP